MRLALNLASNPSPKSAAFVYFVIYPEPPDYMFSFASNQDHITKATLAKLLSIRDLLFFITAIHVAFFRRSSHRSAKPDIANSHVPLETAELVTQHGSEEVDAHGVNRYARIQVLWQSA